MTFEEWCKHKPTFAEQAMLQVIEEGNLNHRIKRLLWRGKIITAAWLTIELPITYES